MRGWAMNEIKVALVRIDDPKTNRGRTHYLKFDGEFWVDIEKEEYYKIKPAKDHHAKTNND
jgi:hypothetical protein